MHLLLLDLDGSLRAQSSLRDAAPWQSVRTIDASDIAPRLRLWARARTIDEMRHRLDGLDVGSTIALLGSGDITVSDVGGDFRVGSRGSGDVTHRNVRGKVSVPHDDDDDDND